MCSSVKIRISGRIDGGTPSRIPGGIKARFPTNNPSEVTGWISAGILARIFENTGEIMVGRNHSILGEFPKGISGEYYWKIPPQIIDRFFTWKDRNRNPKQKERRDKLSVDFKFLEETDRGNGSWWIPASISEGIPKAFFGYIAWESTEGILPGVVGIHSVIIDEISVRIADVVSGEISSGFTRNLWKKKYCSIPGAIPAPVGHR